MSDHVRNTTNADEMNAAAEDARLFGAGYLLVLPDGSVTRIEPERVTIKPKEARDAK